MCCPSREKLGKQWREILFHCHLDRIALYDTFGHLAAVLLGDGLTRLAGFRLGEQAGRDRDRGEIGRGLYSGMDVRGSYEQSSGDGSRTHATQPHREQQSTGSAIPAPLVIHLSLLE